MPEVRIIELREFISVSLQQVEVSATDAAVIADILVDSELRTGYGAAVLGPLIGWYQRGVLNPRPDIQVVHETASTLLLDGDRACGMLAAVKAMRWCVVHAHSLHGVVSACVRNSGTCGPLAPYVTLAAEWGLLGFACTTANALMPAPGARTPVFGTDPMAYGVPAGNHPPIVFDMATTAVAMNRVQRAAAAGQAVPDGWIADSHGQPTNNPADFVQMRDGQSVIVGLMLPLGSPNSGYKGFGLAMMVDILAGILSGGAFAQDVNLTHSNVGQFFWALDISAFMSIDQFRARIDQQIDEIKSSELVVGNSEVLIPGERGYRRRQDMLAKGSVPLTDFAWESLTSHCETLGVTAPGVTSTQITSPSPTKRSVK